MKKCAYCPADDDPLAQVCAASDKGFVCTREPLHAGDHAACTTDAHVVHQWVRRPETLRRTTR
jgi:hypothetical protein